MLDEDEEGVFYPTTEEILDVHEQIIEDDPAAEPGVSNEGAIKYALDHIKYGSHGEGPETVHEKAYQLMRLLAANHPFVDGNKRTALASASIFYFWNGLDLDYQEELEAMLILISIREDFINEEVAVEYLEGITEEWDFHNFGWLEDLTDILFRIAENMREDFDDTT